MKSSRKLYKTLSRLIVKMDAEEEECRAKTNPLEPTTARDHWTAMQGDRRLKKERKWRKAALAGK